MNCILAGWHIQLLRCCPQGPVSTYIKYFNNYNIKIYMHILKTLQIILKKFIKNYSGKTDTILNTVSNSFEMFKKVEYL